MNTGRKELWSSLLFLLLVAVDLCAIGKHARAFVEDDARSETSNQCVIVELFVDQNRLLDQQLETRIREFAKERGGILLAVRKLQDGTGGKNRLDQIASHFKIEAGDRPLLYCLNQIIHGKQTVSDYQQSLEQLLQFEVFVRTGCSRCEAMKRFLPTYARRFPAMKVVYRDIAKDSSAVQKLNQLVSQYNRAASSVPVIHLCGELSIGFINESTSQKRLDDLLRKWTKECPRAKPISNMLVPKDDTGRNQFPIAYSVKTVSLALDNQETQQLSETRWASLEASMLLFDTSELLISGLAIRRFYSNQPPTAELPLVEGESEIQDDELMLPLDAAPIVGSGEDAVDIDLHNDQNTIEVPWIGSLNANQLGMPLFTIAVGLVDGFNPCAMWVLLFLLSILVNLRDRFRVVLIAGIFVLISGLAYFAFMAAWLNVFLFVGLLRPIQITLGLLALLVGGIHIKDFFAFKKGVSLSIPESAKPGIYQRARSVVTAQNLFGALVGVTILAILVNMVELLCTAGLPALYTGVLTMQKFPAWQNYAYLALYIVAYMFDDTLMVAIVVWTMKKSKMQESQGRWLKLVSGVVIVAIGLVMLFRPSLLY